MTIVAKLTAAWIVLMSTTDCVMAGPQEDLKDYWKESRPIQDTKADGHVVFLTGIVGDGVESPSAAAFQAMLHERKDVINQTLTSEMWNWHLHSDHMFDLLGKGPRNKARGKVLALRLRKWRARNPDKSIYLVAGSGSGAVAALACESTDRKKRILPAGFFKRIVIVSTTLEHGDELISIKRASALPVCSYYSTRDPVLSMVHKNSAGMKGFTKAGILECGTKDEKHMGCYQKAVAEKLLLPLFHKDGDHLIPKEWALPSEGTRE